MTLGLELTFLPRKRPAGLPSGPKIDALVARFNKALDKRVNGQPYSLCDFRAKSEGLGLFGRVIEVVHCERHIHHVNIDEPALRNQLDTVFSIARDLDLVARSSFRRQGTLRLRPNGGGHIHTSMDVFPHGADFLPRLTAFQQALFTSYANRPYIRWLFAHPFDDINSSVTYNLAQLKDSGRKGVVEQMHECPYVAAEGAPGILARFSGSRGTILPTFEHRYFDATANTKETLANLRFLKAWINSVVGTIDVNRPRRLIITPAYFKRLKNLSFAWREISIFLHTLDLKPADYRALFERNYVTRMEWGKML